MSAATDVAFYHLTKWHLEHALAKLLERTLNQNLRTVVRVASEQRLADLNQSLWTYDVKSFLPHGSPSDGYVEQQPIYLTTGSEVPNGATVLILTDNLDAADIKNFARCVDIFDGTEEAVKEAYKRWVQRSKAGYSQTYWRQTRDGRWTKHLNFEPLSPSQTGSAQG